LRSQCSWCPISRYLQKVLQGHPLMKPIGLLIGQNQEWFSLVLRSKPSTKICTKLRLPMIALTMLWTRIRLNADVQWLKDHPGDRFFIEGYASATGSEAYNLKLSGQRAWWVRQVLIRKGIAEDRIVLAVPWGMLYPACLESTEECHAKNRVVRFAHSPNLSNTAE
jgi:hypothetical protein